MLCHTRYTVMEERQRYLQFIVACGLTRLSHLLTFGISFQLCEGGENSLRLWKKLFAYSPPVHDRMRNHEKQPPGRKKSASDTNDQWLTAVGGCSSGFDTLTAYLARWLNAQAAVACDLTGRVRNLHKAAQEKEKAMAKARK